jgi:hypothetical protein
VEEEGSGVDDPIDEEEEDEVLLNGNGEGDIFL